MTLSWLAPASGARCSSGPGFGVEACYGWFDRRPYQGGEDSIWIARGTDDRVRGVIWVIVIVVAIVVLLLLVVVAMFNKLVRLRNRSENAWAQVDVQLRKRYDLIPNLVETVKGYAAHERRPSRR